MAPDPDTGHSFSECAVACSGHGIDARFIHRIKELAECGDAVFISPAPLWYPHPTRAKFKPPTGLLIDQTCHHFDPNTPGDLETLLATHPLDNTHDLNRARDAIARIAAGKLSGRPFYNRDATIPPAGYILVLDQPRNDPRVIASNGDAALFSEMLYYAQENHPGQPVVIMPALDDHRKNIGFFNDEHITRDNISIYDQTPNDWDMLTHAGAVYTVSSDLGVDAIFAGHKPFVFGKPFYAGWGLTHDSFPIPRRKRVLTRAQLFLGAMMIHPKWYDPCGDTLCDIDTLLNQLESAQRAYVMDQKGWQAQNIRLWKRPALRHFFGGHAGITFRNSAPASAQPMIWGPTTPDGMTNITRVEDGFIRSRGLGADLVPPLSLVCDQSGMYFDPTRPSDLETLLARSPNLRGDQRSRAQSLIAKIVNSRVSKYNLGGTSIHLPKGHRILVPGQVQDDASIRLGCPEIATNLELLKRVRNDNPNAVIIYKPHPDVAIGLRQGAISASQMHNFADVIAQSAPITDLLDAVDSVHTLTSLTGFEALLRKKSVTTYGQPFYAGWGLTTDLAPQLSRRGRALDLETLVHRVLIDYPRYFDPVTQMACPVETVLYRIAHDQIRPPSLANRGLARLQRIFAPYARFWR